MTLNEGLFSSKSDEWTTPRWLFEQLDAIFHFELDAAATAENALCEKYFTIENSGLLQSWGGYTAVFCNPPYSKIRLWAEKFVEESTNTVIVALIPARVDTKWWHDSIITADIIKFVKGRLRFGQAASSAPFPSAVAVWLGLEEALRRPEWARNQASRRKT